MSQRRRGPDPAARRRTVTDAEASEHLQDLSLEELRAYRQRLTDEEERTSYWRRLVHARMDVLEAESHVDGSLGIDDLVRVLGDTGSGQTRTQLLRIRPADPLPELPVLEEMWVTELDPNDTEAVRAAVERLRTAEQQLTDYRRALHERLDTATETLIARYRDDPAPPDPACARPHVRSGGMG